MNTSFTSRRTVLAAAGTASIALSLAACGGSGGGEPEGGGSPSAGEETDGGGGSPSAGEETAEGGGTGEPDGGGALVKTSEVPEGGGKILTSEKVVVTQPSAGQFKAYSAVCQHQGCLVSSVADGTINCACHGSRYAIGDGSVTQGPATRALPGVNISVKGGAVRRG